MMFLNSQNDKQSCMKIPFVIYADFESLIEKVTSCQPNPQLSSTTHKQKHKACGYSYVVVCSNDKYFKFPVVFRGNNAVDHFLNHLMKEEAYMRREVSYHEESFQGDTHCIICGIRFTEKSKQVRDHDHLCVKRDVNSPNYCNFRDATCQACNLQLKAPSFIPSCII